MTISFADGFDWLGGSTPIATVTEAGKFFVKDETTEVHTERYSVISRRVSLNKWEVVYSPVGAPEITFECNQPPKFTLGT